jgi:hypothetical protein
MDVVAGLSLPEHCWSSHGDAETAIWLSIRATQLEAEREGNGAAPSPGPGSLFSATRGSVGVRGETSGHERTAFPRLSVELLTVSLEGLSLRLQREPLGGQCLVGRSQQPNLDQLREDGLGLIGADVVLDDDTGVL